MKRRKPAKYLLKTKDVIQTYYKNQVVVKAAEEMKKDPEGKEYQMREEMHRDTVKWHLCMAGLTGFFLDHAVKYFNKAINEAEMGSSAWAVAVMEKNRPKTTRQKNKLGSLLLCLSNCSRIISPGRWLGPDGCCFLAVRQRVAFGR